MLCDPHGPCAFHSDGGPPGEPCPDMCDEVGCRAIGVWAIVEAPIALPDTPARFCTVHLVDFVGRSLVTEIDRGGNEEPLDPEPELRSPIAPQPEHAGVCCGCGLPATWRYQKGATRFDLCGRHRKEWLDTVPIPPLPKKKKRPRTGRA